MNKKKQKNHATIIKSPPSQRRVNVFINIIFNSKKESKQGTSEIKKNPSLEILTSSQEQHKILNSKSSSIK